MKRKKRTTPVKDYGITYRGERLLALVLSPHVNVNMAQRSVGLWAPSPMLDPVFVTFVQHLDQVLASPITIVPMQFANLVVAMEQVQTTFTASTSVGTDFANAVGRDHDLVDHVFMDRFSTIVGVLEFAAAERLAMNMVE